MKKEIPYFTILFLVFTYTFCHTQNKTSKSELVGHFNFTEHSFARNNELITYYKYHNGTKTKENLVIYIQGSDPSPLFTWTIKNNNVKHYCHLPRDFMQVPENYLFVAIEKIGFEKLTKFEDRTIPATYRQKNSLQNRVFRINEVIHKLSKEHSFEKIVVYGHSEGAPVAAKLATVNSKITHLGFWCGNLLPDFFDFALESRKAFYRGDISVLEAQKQIDETISGFVNEIATDTTNTEGEGYTKLRWWSYAEPPINYLIKIDIPIFMLVSTNDESAPIESSYIAPLEFARLQKKNLTYKVCLECDHGLTVIKGGKRIKKWSSYFKEFINWVQMIEE